LGIRRTKRGKKKLPVRGGKKVEMSDAKQRG
jgi:hypothetical protein